MRSSSIVVAAVASLFFLNPAHAQYEGLSKFHWKRFVDKNEKQTAAMIAADLARVAAEYRVAETLAGARLAHFQDRIAATVEPIDLEAHGHVVQLSAVTVTVTSGDGLASGRPERQQDPRQLLAATIAERENLTTGSTRRAELPRTHDTSTSPKATPPAAEPWWSAPISALLSKLGW